MGIGIIQLNQAVELGPDLYRWGREKTVSSELVVEAGIGNGILVVKAQSSYILPKRDEAKKELHEITLQDLSVGPADSECKEEASPVNLYPGPSAPSGGLLFNCLWHKIVATNVKESIQSSLPYKVEVGEGSQLTVFFFFEKIRLELTLLVMGLASSFSWSYVPVFSRTLHPHDWAEELAFALWAYRTYKRGSNLFSPYTLVDGEEAFLPAEIDEPSKERRTSIFIE
ncbi:hypothetical protein Dimus_035997 [Dionaea muscipula]